MSKKSAKISSKSKAVVVATKSVEDEMETTEVEVAAPLLVQEAVMNPRGLPAGSDVRQLSKLKRFLTTVHTFANDISVETGDCVKRLILDLTVTSFSFRFFSHFNSRFNSHFNLNSRTAR